MTKLNIIVAYANNRGIGNSNKLPWNLPSDLAYFKKTTIGCPIIMGRKTYDSIGRALPGRLNIIVSRNTELDIDGVTIVNELDAAIQKAEQEAKEKDLKDIFVIGGAEIFKLALSRADTIYATEIHHDIEADTFFPEFGEPQWQEASRQPVQEENHLNFDFVVYHRNQAT